MKTTRKLSSTLVAAALCVVSTGWSAVRAQEASTDQPLAQQTTDSTINPLACQKKSRCTQLIGTRVENQNGERLGRITDVVISFDNEHVSYCVLKVNHGMFAKNRLVEVPLAAFQPSADGSRLILNADRSNLANARGFDPSEWPSAINTVWGAEPPPPTELPPAQVYSQPIVQPVPSLGAARPGDSSWNWDQFPCPRTAPEAIAQMQFEMIYGLPLSSH
jgi:sporulation protein YlmC with PRC-barrel domain